MGEHTNRALYFLSHALASVGAELLDVSWATLLLLLPATFWICVSDVPDRFIDLALGHPSLVAKSFAIQSTPFSGVLVFSS